MNATESHKKLYWDSRAINYPRPFDASIISKTRKMIRGISEFGVNFNNKDILDIGCGSGVYALALAKRSRSVTGVDSSQAMLSIFNSVCEEKHIVNAKCFKSEWADVKDENINKKYDIAIASMTAAVRDEKEVVKMSLAAREFCIYIGWAGERRNKLMEKVYEHHGIKYLPPQGAETVIKSLESIGQKYEVIYLYDAWFKTLTTEQTLSDIAVNMEVNDAVFDKQWTSDLLNKISKNGMVRQKTKVKKAIIVWKPS